MNLLYRLALKVVTPDPVTVVEGGPVVMIGVQSSLPPKLSCNQTDTNCEFHITAVVEITGDDLVCLGGEGIPQALVGYMDNYDMDVLIPCGLKITNTNWYNILQIPVIATTDMTVDMNVTRHMTVYYTLQIQTSISIQTTMISQIQV